MKYIVLLCDGMADIPNTTLNNRTPMSVAKKPTMNCLAKYSQIGLVKTVPYGFPAGSDVANLSVLGYDPVKYYTGRSPLEAASIGVPLSRQDITMRCNFVTLSDDEDQTLIDYCADDISTDEASVLIEFLKKEFQGNSLRFYTGMNYRHCVVSTDENLLKTTFTPPHDITGKKIASYLPKGSCGETLIDLMRRSYLLLKDHPINIKRKQFGKHPANAIWFWGQGIKTNLDPFSQKFLKQGSIISAVDLVKGIGICADMHVCNVEGATGYIDTNFTGKMQAAVEELKRGQDFVYIHVEAPDECGHRGELEQKIKSIELIDELILCPLLDAVSGLDDYKLMILPDHPTPLSIKTHTSEPVPFMIYDSRVQQPQNEVTCFDEQSATETDVFFGAGYALMPHFLK